LKCSFHGIASKKLVYCLVRVRDSKEINTVLQ
jgi:hypothetical protein